MVSVGPGLSDEFIYTDDDCVMVHTRPHDS